MRLIKDKASVWETHFIEGYPFGIEKIDRGAWYAFRLWGNDRIYLMTRGEGKDKARAICEQAVEDYKARIIVAVTA